jgi:endonuclease/exonuclease/phosphatase (EEP) superfamily protein YafD
VSFVSKANVNGEAPDMTQTSKWMRSRKISSIIFTMIADMVGLYSTLLIVLWALSGERLWFVALWVNLLPGAFYPLLFAFVIVIFTRKTHTIALLILPFLTCIIMYGGRFLPVRPQSDNSGQSITVMTYNLMVNTRDINSFSAIVEAADADIVALQEVHRDMLALIATQAENYPYQIPAADTVLDETYMGRMLLSRYPILESQDMPSLHPNHMLGQRVQIDINGESVTLFNLHLILP